MSGQARPRVYVAGHRGLVGSALVRRLEREPVRLVTRPRAELDLEDPVAVRRFFEDERPDQVYLAAAKVGGIWANATYPADFIRNNLLVTLNVLEAARETGVAKLLYLGSSCIYPKMAPQPIPEEALLAGPLEPTNEPYAIAKIAGISLCRSYNRQYGTNFVSVMPTNLYGPGDNFDLATSHVLPALLRKVHEAKVTGAPTVTVWGSGTPRREFLHVDDLADACVHLMRVHDGSELVNIGCGDDIAIADLARLVADVVGYHGALVFDASKPDGTPRKLLDVRRLAALGWSARIPLREGIAGTYQWFLRHAQGTG
ncbi:MAG: GDP-L-fucose synthase [Gemmatimonadetes bacterium]|nr:GDP-L-fucose synthase [Gemmatimonadota bacterium]